MNNPLLIANWKMQVAVAASGPLARSVVSFVAGSSGSFHLVLCPSFVSIPSVQREVEHSRVLLGAQDVSGLPRGARTGDVSALDLFELGCTYCIIGHSERRTYHCEQDEEAREKVFACVQTGSVPVLCVGETADERMRQKTHAVISQQLRTALKDVLIGPKTRIVVAYEPVWAISPAVAATPEQITEPIAQINHELSDMGIPESIVTILYGGSVNASSVRGFLRSDGFNGFLIGTESQDEKRFLGFLDLFRS